MMRVWEVTVDLSLDQRTWLVLAADLEQALAKVKAHNLWKACPYVKTITGVRDLGALEIGEGAPES